MPRKAQTAGRGEGSIFRRGTRWYAELGLGVDPTTGKRRVWRATGALRKEVAAALATARAERARGALPPPSTDTVLDWWTLWLAAKSPSLMPATLANYRLNGLRLMPLIGQVRLTALDEARIDRAYARLLERGLKGKPLSRRSVEQAHSVLTNCLDDAVGRRVIARNPAAYASVPRPPRSHRPTLDQPEVDRLLAVAAGTRWAALWLLFVTTGLRSAEALRLRWRQVDLVARRATILGTKSDRASRSVPLGHRLVAALERHRELLQADGIATGQTNDVFPSLTGKTLDPSTVRERLAVHLARAGCPDVTVHDLRHTSATLLLGRNVHPKIVQELLGHSTVVVTLQTYSHVIPAMSGLVADHFDELFPEPLDPSPVDAHTPTPTTAPTGQRQPLSNGNDPKGRR